MAHSSNYWSTFITAIPFAILGTSLMGSGHCVAMCGGLMISVARDFKTTWLYHLGRLIGYSILGALAGFLGQKILDSSSLSFFSKLTAVLMAVGFVYMGIQLTLGKSPYLFKLPSTIITRLHLFGGQGPFSIGLLSAVLPCGWLHTFVLGSISLKDPLKGAFYLFLFWLGTLPALSFSSFAVLRLFQPYAKQAPKLLGLFFISLGLYSLWIKIIYVQACTTFCHPFIK